MHDKVTLPQYKVDLDFEISENHESWYLDVYFRIVEEICALNIGKVNTDDLFKSVSSRLEINLAKI